MENKIDDTTNKPRVLVAPLDWGLGHATRCIAVIHALKKNGAEPVVGAYGSGYAFLKSEFPDMEIFDFPGFSLTYPTGKDVGWKVVIALPRLLISLVREKLQLARVIRDRNINAIISDSRFGLFTRKVPSVFMSHQLLVKLPRFIAFLEYPFHIVLSFFIKKYDYCWIPDLPGKTNLSGELGHKYITGNSRYIGPLNRFDKPTGNNSEFMYDVMIIISGLEKQRTVFERLILDQIRKSEGFRIIIIRGIPGEQAREEIRQNVKMYSHLPAEQLFESLMNSRVVVCRPGYSTIMELSGIGKKAIFIPTPGQTEQEYLADYMESNGYAPYYHQSEFNLNKALEKVESYKGIPKLDGTNLLDIEAGKLMETVRNKL